MIKSFSDGHVIGGTFSGKVSNGSVTKMDIYSQFKEKVMQLFQATQFLAESHGDKEIKSSLKDAAQRLQEGKLFVVVCGEFKQGKSSLLNALLDGVDLFPVDVDITTSLVTTISYAESEKIVVLVGKPGQEKSITIRRDEIPLYVTEQQNKGNSREARMLIIEGPFEKLKSGLTLVDTPGVGGLNQEHTDITYAFIPNSDAIIFVSDAFKPLSQIELNFLSTRVIRHCQNVIYVVTKIDTNPDYQKIVDNNRQKLAQVMGKPGEEIPIIPVSSLNKLDYLESHDPEDLEYSNFPVLEDKLWQQLSGDRGYILLMNALSVLGQTVSKMKRPLEAEYEACKQDNKAELEKLQQQLKEAIERRNLLLENNAEWLMQLNYGFKEISSDINYRFNDGFMEINNQASEYLEDERLIENHQYIASLLEADIDALISDLGKQLSRQAGALHTRLVGMTDLNINPFNVLPLNPDKPHPIEVKVQTSKAGMFDKAVAATRGALYNATPGMIVGGILGALVGGLFTFGIGAAAGAEIGAAIGSSISAARGARSAWKQVDAKDTALRRQQVSSAVTQYLKQSQLYCKKAIDKSLASLEQSMQQELRKQIHEEKRLCESSQQSIQQAQKMTQEQVVRRLDQLKSILQKFEQIQGSVTDYVTMISANSQEPLKQTAVTKE
jgi:predicted GTPase